jgi:hypothetical protein
MRRALLVFVAVMKVWIVRMPVPQSVMPMPVRMRLGDHAFVRVLMMGIVDMAMFVLDRFVHVIMLMAFGQMQPEAKSHQRAGEGELSHERLTEENDRDGRAKEWSKREISACPRAAEMTQGQNKQDETDSDAEKPDHERRANRAERRQAGAEKQRQTQIHAAGD